MAAVSKIVAVILFIYLFYYSLYICICITFFALTLFSLFLSTIHGVYTRDCSCVGVVRVDQQGVGGGPRAAGIVAAYCVFALGVSQQQQVHCTMCCAVGSGHCPTGQTGEECGVITGAHHLMWTGSSEGLNIECTVCYVTQLQ